MKTQMKKIAAVLFLALLWTSSALAQSSPGWSYGTVPTPAQWNAAFAGKQDFTGGALCSTAGCIMSGTLTTATPSATLVPFIIPQGAAPTSPPNGAIWTTSAGMFAEINGATVGPFTSSTVASIIIGTTTITGGNANGLLYNNGGLAGNLATANNGVLITSGAGLPSISSTLPSGLSIPSPTVTTAFTATGLVTLADLATQAANTVLVNATSGAASPTAQAVSTCSAAGDALNWTTNAGFGCNTSITAAAVPASGLTGATLATGVTASSLTSLGTLTALTVSGTATLSGITGTVQCLHVNTSGVISGTGSDCGSGGGGGTPGGSNTQVQVNSSGVFGGISGVTSNGTSLTIANADLILSGSSSGSSTLEAPATGGGVATLPAGAGTLVYSNVAALSSLTSVGTIGTGTWQGTAIAPTYGGTGQNTSSSTGVPQVASGTWSVSTTLPSGLTAPSLTVTSAFTATGLVTNADLVNSTITLGSTAMSLGSTYTTIAGSLTLSGTINISGTFQSGGNAMTFPGSAATIAALNLADQTLSGGANVTSDNLGTVTTGTTTIDCGLRPLQYMTNGGASTLSAPVNDGTCAIQITNNSGAGAITFSGFTVNSSYTGAIPDTTNGHKFVVFIARANGSSIYNVVPQQ